MPLSAEAKATNIERSLTDWIEAHLRTAAGLSVFYGMAPVGDLPNQWVHVDYLLGLRRDFGRQVDRTQLGGRAHGILNLNLARQRATITSSYNLTTLRDTVAAVFQRGQTIPLRDYGTSGTPVIGHIEVEGMTEAVTDDGLTSGVIVVALSIEIAYMEAWTLA